jgi:hypothetical protein
LPSGVKSASCTSSRSRRGAPVAAVEIHKGWMEIESFDDYRRAWREVQG